MRRKAAPEQFALSLWGAHIFRELSLPVAAKAAKLPLPLPIWFWPAPRFMLMAQMAVGGCVLAEAGRERMLIWPMP